MAANYYAVIPASVRYDKNLKPNVKLLYGEITALTNDKGYCWATNSYFAELYQVSKETVSRWISQLEQSGYITTELIYGDKKEIKERRIRLGIEIKTIESQDEQSALRINTPCQNNQEVLTKKSRPIDKKVKTPIDKKVKDNNTLSFNNTVNNTLEYNPPLSPQGENEEKEKIKPTPKTKTEKEQMQKELDRLNNNPTLQDKIQEWIEYKKERKEPYKPQGFKAFISLVENKSLSHSDTAIAEVIDFSMAAGYKGIVWDRLDKPKQGNKDKITSFLDIDF